MKRILFICIILILISVLYSSKLPIDLNYEKTDSRLLRNDIYGIEANFMLSEIVSFDVNTPEGTFSQLNVPGYTHTSNIGAPKLPAIRKIIAVPFGAEIKITSLNYQSTEYRLDDYGINYPVMPAQPPVPKSADPSTIKFKYDAQAYLETSYSDKNIVRVEEIGIMRGVRLFTLIVEPIQYNPVSGLIKVFNNIDVCVDFTGADLAETNLRRAKTYSPYFESAYQNYIFNYTPISSREDLTRYPIKYVIISDPMFEAQLEPFIDWKIQKGFEVIAGYTNDPAVGGTTTSIRNYIQTLWDAATPESPAPSFILFVGDVAQIPAWNGSTGGHITDLNYVKMEGGDYLPEIYYGRFSANNETELQPQIDKTLEYEKYEMPDPSFLGEVVMIAGMDAYHGSTWGNGQINYGTDNYFNAAHGILSHTYLYPNSGSNSANIIQNVSDGVSYINYTAHGSSTSWSDPSFTIANINGLQNESKYCLAVGNCCLTNKFEVLTCFGEAWLRAENKGAIGYIGGTNSTYWDEDYWWGVGAGTVTANPTYAGTGPGAYDGMFHDHGEPFNEWYTTSYAVIMAGNLAVVQGGGMMNYYWEIYSIMGDPSLTAYFGVPSDNIVSYPSTIFLGLTSVQISAEPYSYVSISMNGVSHGVGLVDASGVIDLEIDPFVTPGLAQLVITRQNRVPIIEDIEVIPNAGPYIIVSDFVINDDNNNIPEYNEIITLDVTFENVGIEEALNVNATLSTDDTYINIISDYVEIGDIAAGSTITITDAFEIDIADDIPDQHQIFFDVEIVGSSTWNSVINIIFNAPAFEIGNMIINDSGGNGILDPGETATLSVPITNIGHATSQDIFSQLINGTPNLITLIEDSFNLTGLAPEEEGYADFDIEVDEGAEPGTIAILDFIATSGGYNLSNTFYLTIGLVVEDFETGDFSMYPWEFIGNADWQITDLEVYEGVYSAKSGVISHNQSSTIFVELDVIADGEISFWKKVSCENDPNGTDYDYLAFYIDGNEQARWDGEIDWNEESYFVAAGNHNFKWIYDKDGYVSSGQDCAWIDYIVFPPFEPEVSTDDMSVIPSIIKLCGNYPNPFNPSTTITYSLNKDSKVTLEIYNIKGQKVRTLVNKEQPAGNYKTIWNGKDDNDRSIASGIYFYKMKAGGRYTSTKKMILLK
ncbi:MAG: T9SS type A sorting domain-containing protein [Candidatus Cloacimonetes bacterium]|nr:T9SS type A sorting domain-containing protein [Candidatus Cloacimonadota bacterium]